MDRDKNYTLAELSAEVGRISGILAGIAPHNLATKPVEAQPTPRQPTPRQPTASEVRAVIRRRRMRDQYFSEGLFEDPAWDMLLDLYAAELEGSQVSVSSLCIAAAVAPTTALRWIARMSADRLIDHVPDPFDRRRRFVLLTGEGRDRMARYFAAVADRR